MPIRFTWPAALLAPRRPPEMVPVTIERLCRHEERVTVAAVRGMFDRLVRERKRLCSRCAERFNINLWEDAARLRICYVNGLWGVERLILDTRGVTFLPIVFAASYSECLEYIRATFAGLAYVLLDAEVSLA